MGLSRLNHVYCWYDGVGGQTFILLDYKKNMIAAKVIQCDDLVTVSSTNSGCSSIYSCHDGRKAQLIVPGCPRLEVCQGSARAQRQKPEDM